MEECRETLIMKEIKSIVEELSKIHQTEAVLLERINEALKTHKNEDTPPYLIDIKRLNLSNRTYGALCRNGVSTVADVLEHPNLFDIRGLGKKGRMELEYRMHEFGYTDFQC